MKKGDDQKYNLDKKGNREMRNKGFMKANN